MVPRDAQYLIRGMMIRHEKALADSLVRTRLKEHPIGQTVRICYGSGVRYEEPLDRTRNRVSDYCCPGGVDWDSGARGAAARNAEGRDAEARGRCSVG